MTNWPKYYQNQLIAEEKLGIAVVCGWTKKEVVWNMFSGESREKVSIMGQLYSKEGINYIIRNLFLNPKIKFLVITGADLSGSVQELKNFLVTGQSEYLHPEIPKEKISEFYNYFKMNHAFVSIDKINSFIDELRYDNSEWTNEVVDFPSHNIEASKMFLSEDVGFRIEGGKVCDVWLKVLDRITRFGKDKMSSYGECQLELLDTITVINDDNPDNPYLPDYLYFNEHDLNNYYPQLMTDKIFEGVEYTYGSRFRNHNGIDQVRGMIDELKKEVYSRRAIAFTWNVEKDFNNEKCPCLDLIQALVQNGKVYLTAYFRSNDMYRAWPQNAYGLLKIQKEIADALGLKVGKLVIISCSAHIYERDMKDVRNLLKKHKPTLECNIDFRGSFVIQTEGREIVARHIDLDGVFLQEIRGNSAIEIRDKIVPFVSDVAHGIYLGSELMKAEMAIREGKEYIQDS